jgi:DNA-binding winged helix-turn-helix (wHTH) protein
MRVDTYLSPIRFGVFELDLRTGELREKGAKVKLDGQPIQILMLLLERPGELLTHEEIRAKLWPDGTVVEFESSIKTALRKLRQALGDDAEAPRYIENLPRRGYRFIAPVDGMVAVGAGLPTAAGQVAPPKVTPEGEPLSGTRAPQGIPLQATPGGAVREAPLRAQWALRTAAVLAMLVVGLAAGEGALGVKGVWGIPSPDGRYLAIATEGMDSNLWMVENF